MFGTVAYVSSEYAGTSSVGVEAIGQTVISVDSVDDFALDLGVVVIGGLFYPFNAVDRVNSTITLTSGLEVALNPGTEIRQFPLSLKRWALVEATDFDVPTDAVWALIPHSLAAFFAEDGPRESGSRERVKAEQDNNLLVIVDVLDRVPQLNRDAIPDNLITETKIEPGSITTPLLAANAVATQNLQAGAVVASTIDTDALNGKVITGALVRSSATGRRVELSATGLVQIDESGAIILSIGNTNKFSGQVDTDNMLIRDGLELFGKNNYIKTGAEVVLATGQGGSSTAPTLTNFYEVSPVPIALYVAQTVGMFADGAEARIDRATNFFTYSSLRKGANYYQFPTVNRSDGSPVGGVDVQAYTRIKTASGERAVVLAYQHPAGEAPGALTTPLNLLVYDDNSMNSSGTVAPTAKPAISFNFQPSVSFFRSVALGKLWGSAGWEQQYCIGEMINNGSTAYVNLAVVNVTNDTTMTIPGTASNVTFPLSAADERISGIAYGSLGAMKFLPSGHPNAGNVVWVIMTNYKNLIWSVADLSPTGRYTMLEWPVTPTQQFFAATEGDLSNSLSGFTRFVNSKQGAVDASDPAAQKIVWYSNTTWDDNVSGSNNPIWAQFAWKGHSSKVSPEWLTSPSVYSAPTTRVKRSRQMISVPAIPTPAGGVGAARDVNLDIYSWVYYTGQKASQPLRTEMWRQSNTPAGEPTTVQSLVLPETLLGSGTNPLVSTQGFTALTPAKIRSGTGTHYFDGDGNLVANIATVSELNDAGVIGVAGILSSTQSIPDSTWTTVTNWGSLAYLPSQTPSEAGIVPIGSGLWRIDKPGWYDIKFGWGFNFFAAGSRYGGIAINGTRKVSTGWKPADFESGGFIAWEGRISSAQTVGFHVFENAGGAMNLIGLSGSEYRTWMSIRRVRT